MVPTVMRPLEQTTVQETKCGRKTEQNGCENYNLKKHLQCLTILNFILTRSLAPRTMFTR